MVPTERAVLLFFILILCTINGLHSYPHKHHSLGILNELIRTDSKSPLIVVVDSNNQAKTLDDESAQGYGEGPGQSHSKSCPNHPDNNHSPSQSHNKNSDKFSNQDYEAALYELLRTSQKMMEKQGRKGSSNNGKNGKWVGKKDSCEEDNQKELLAEQCTDNENSCEFDDEKDTC